MKTLKTIFIALSIVFCLSAFAASGDDSPALVMLKGVANKMIAELESNKGQLANNDKLIYGIVRRVLMPKCDLGSMSQSVVGRNYWQQATPALQKQFVDEFSFYVVRTYSGPLSSYKGETVKFYPIRGYNPASNKLQVDSDVIRHDGPPVRVSYRVYNAGGNNWKIYDFSVEGVSIVLNYRSQFAATLRQGGLTQLVKDLSAKNKEAR